MLEIDNLHTHYGKSHILHGVSINIEDGELVSLLGRNGAGKSTTLKSIMGIVQQSSGNIRLDGNNLAGMQTHQITKMGIAYVPEDRRMFSELTVLDNLKISIIGKPGWTLDDIYDLFPVLKSRSNLRAKNLSGGEQQMLAIGRALLNNPRVLLLDEPFEGLAPILIQTLIQSIQQIRNDKVAILLVEQNLNATLKLADRHYVIEQGIIVYEGDSEDFKSNEAVREKYLSV